MSNETKTKHGLPTYDSQVACAAAIGVSTSRLRQAKRAGCDAFKGGRVDLEVFLRWHFANDSAAGTDWSQALKKVQTEREQIKLAEDQKRVVDFAVVETFHAELIGGLFQDLQRSFCDELPPSLKGRDEIAIRTRCDGEIERMKSLLRGRLTNWKSSHAPTAQAE